MTISRLVKSWFAVFMVAFPLWAAAEGAGSRALVVAVEGGFPPYLQVDETGKPTGFSVELLEAIAKVEGLAVQWRVENWDHSLKLLSSGAVDLVPMMSYSKERDTLFDFSDPTMTSDDAIFVRRGEKRVQAAEDLYRSRVIVERDGFGHQFLARRGYAEGLILATSTDEAMLRLSRGEGDAMLTTRLTGMLLVRQLGLDNIERLSVNINWYERIHTIATREGNREILEVINRGLKRVRENGTYDKLFEKWIASADQVVIEQNKNLRILRGILLFAFVFVFIAAFFVWLLRRTVEEKTSALRQEVKERKAAEKKLEKQLYELRFLRETIDTHAIVMRVDHSGILTDINSKACRITGYERQELVGKSMASMVVDAGDKSIDPKHIESLNDGQIWQGETKAYAKSGKSLYFSSTIVPHNNGEKRPDFYLVASTDITLQKDIERQQAELKRQLQQAAKMESIGRLTGGIAHDFNNILASIIGFTDLTLTKFGDELNEKAKQYLEEVYRSGERARDLIAQMMTFSRTETGDSKTVDAVPVVKEALQMLQPTLPSSIQISCDITDQQLPVLMDPIKLHQIVVNLIINARDAIGSKGNITIQLGTADIIKDHCASCHQSFSGRFIELSITDTGEGISADIIEKIFDPFFTTKGIGAGTGMGLSVVHGIVHEHKGHIRINSSPDKGTQFSVLFHVVENGSTCTEEDARAVNVQGQLRHILVVDDEPHVGEYLRELLRSYGHRVSLFRDSEEAWKIFQEDPMSFDALVTDQTMPGLLGTELIAKVRGINADMPVVLCSGYPDASIEREAQDQNTKLLSKPIDPQQLLAELG